MQTSKGKLTRLVIACVAITALGLGLFWGGCAKDSQDIVSPQSAVSPSVSDLSKASQIQAVMAIQNKHTDRLLAIDGVVGTATTLTNDGRPAVKIFTKFEGAKGTLPTDLEGVPVVVEATGEFRALQEVIDIQTKGKVNSSSATAKFPRPVPIGVSTGNEGECSAGTISARVKAGSTYYALSNNHVYALENAASVGSRVLQPGLYDTRCVFDASNVIGTLADFEPITFSRSANNVIDAAIALSSTADLGNSTPSNGYGTPKSATVAASVGQKVQKYGRTTSLTKGTVSAINATILVGYDAGTARFVNQIVVSGSKGAFIKAGDSGSLLVTDPNANPVGLLFAGDASGKTAIANPIGPVLTRFSVTIDGN